MIQVQAVREKVQGELAEMKQKTTALANFLATEAFQQLEADQQALLQLQFKHMRHYCSCLELRLA